MHEQLSQVSSDEEGEEVEKKHEKDSDRKRSRPPKSTKRTSQSASSYLPLRSEAETTSIVIKLRGTIRVMSLVIVGLLVAFLLACGTLATLRRVQPSSLPPSPPLNLANNETNKTDTTSIPETASNVFAAWFWHQLDSQESESFVCTHLPPVHMQTCAGLGTEPQDRILPPALAPTQDVAGGMGDVSLLLLTSAASSWFDMSNVPFDMARHIYGNSACLQSALRAAQNCTDTAALPLNFMWRLPATPPQNSSELTWTRYMHFPLASSLSSAACQAAASSCSSQTFLTTRAAQDSWYSQTNVLLQLWPTLWLRQHNWVQVHRAWTAARSLATLHMAWLLFDALLQPRQRSIPHDLFPRSWNELLATLQKLNGTQDACMQRAASAHAGLIPQLLPTNTVTSVAHLANMEASLLSRTNTLSHFLQTPLTWHNEQNKRSLAVELQAEALWTVLGQEIQGMLGTNVTGGLYYSRNTPCTRHVLLAAFWRTLFVPLSLRIESFVEQGTDWAAALGTHFGPGQPDLLHSWLHQ